MTEEINYGSLSQYMAEPTISLVQYQDKVIFNLNLLSTSDDETLRKTLEIPTPFKKSLFCQSIIAFCYSDRFKEIGDTTKDKHINLYNRFFSFLLTRDSQCEKKNIEDKESKKVKWSEMISTLNGDLPHSVISQFLQHYSHEGKGATTIRNYQLDLMAPIKWASTINVHKGEYNINGGDTLLPYIKKAVNPDVKSDDNTPKVALSQLFPIDYTTGEKIECPYTDSQLISSLRWFAHWYLDNMRQRRKFLREIKLDDEKTIYDVLLDRLNDGTWSIESRPVSAMFSRAYKDKGKQPSQADFTDASCIYAKIYEALLPTEDELEYIKNDNASDILKNRLLWLEPLGFTQDDAKIFLDVVTTSHSSIDSIVKRVSKQITYGKAYAEKGGKSKKVIIPISLESFSGLRNITIPSNISLADMIVPTKSERLVMNWLLGSDCIQRSNQIRLKLNDFKRLKRNTTLQILTSEMVEDDEINEAKIRHHKERGKGAHVKRPGKNHETITYKSGDPLFSIYSNWLADMIEAQPYLKANIGKWFHKTYLNGFSTAALFPLSFLCANESLIRSTYQKYEVELKYHSELNGQGAFQWLLTQQIKHFVFCKDKNNDVSEITISPDAVRQSRIIFNEGQDMTDKENSKESAHSEEEVIKYREAGIAKERIQNGIKSNVQVANKMVEEAISILHSCHIMSVEEVQRTLHDPSGFTVDDVIKFINEVAASPESYDVTIFGGIKDKNEKNTGIKIINDKKSAWMLWSYILHMESELESIEQNHEEEQVLKHIFEHAQWSILFERFSTEIQQQAKELSEQYSIPYPPLF
ncbi:MULTISPECIES: hypothetical protein [unclassified Pseudoalteromonas]|uniref:hypothetical protein n=1 Tax=unclassified Pseudoalteromonas TaxID=194690 RepID=UPI0005A9B523|nr:MULTISPECIES: hypothetical protein [unclassified Pseudoalteromonas]